MEIGKIIENRRKELHLTLEQVGKAVGVGKSTVKKWESGYISNMKRDKIALLAKTLEVDPSVFIGGDQSFEPILTPKDERDISKQLDAMLSQLDSKGSALMFDGEPLDDASRELLITSLENSIRMAKIINKRKYTPKKYRKGRADEGSENSGNSK